MATARRPLPVRPAFLNECSDAASPPSGRRAFTFIELLVVLAIIAVRRPNPAEPIHPTDPATTANPYNPTARPLFQLLPSLEQAAPVCQHPQGPVAGS